MKRIIEEGTESFLIRRRNLSTEFTSPDELDKILAQDGTPHNGYSCFVFPRAHYPGYVLDDTCIGLQPVSVTLTINMIQRAVSFQNFSNVRLTFHIGDDSEWKQSLLDDCHLHNERALDRVVHQLAADGLLPYTAKVLELYQRKRSTYVIDNCSNRFSRTLYRAMRKFGFGDWVAARYDNNRY